MTSRGQFVARALLKSASGKSEAAGGALKRLAHGTMNALSAIGEHGGALAEGMGAPRALGTAGALGATYLGGKALVTEGKNRVDQWRAQHGLLPTPPVYPQGYY
jgi:hypothetical protein